MANSGLHFRRVDADIMSKLIEKEENNISALSEDVKASVKTALEELVDQKKYQLSFENMSPTDAPFVVTQNEWMRRMKEQSVMGGGGFYGALPESYNLVANANHPMFASLVTDAEGKVALDHNKFKQAIDLAMLAKGLLKGEDLTAFVKRSWGMIG
jgi:molecular chaperone HtpG